MWSLLRECAEEGYEWGGVGFIAKTGKCTKTIYRSLLGGGVLLLEELAMTSTTIARLFIKENVQNHLFYWDIFWLLTSFDGLRTCEWKALLNDNQ